MKFLKFLSLQTLLSNQSAAVVVIFGVDTYNLFQMLGEAFTSVKLLRTRSEMNRENWARLAEQPNDTNDTNME